MKSTSAPAEPRDLLKQGVELQQSGQLDAAERCYQAVLRQDPSHAEAHHLSGLCAYDRGQFAQAAAAITRAVRAEPDNPLYHCNLGLALRSQGKLAEARRCYDRSIAIAPQFAPALFNLGVLAFDAGQYDEARGHYRAAVRAAPGLPQAHYNLGITLQRLGESRAAIAAYRAALDLDPTYLKAWINLGNTLHQQQRWEEARSAYRQVLTIDPDHASARHMVAALDGATPAQCPAEFVSELFDSYAPAYEAFLVEELGYRVPGELVRLLGDNEPAARFAYALDLGCGTGLVGREIRSRCDRLVGVDLSRQMIAQARQAGVYDQLVAADLTTFLETTEPGYDLVVAADVLIYCGDLEPCFRAVAAGCAAGALWAFSTEVGRGRDYVLQRSGRYGYHQGYIERLATQHGFELRERRSISLRQEYGEPVAGHLFLLRAQ